MARLARGESVFLAAIRHGELLGPALENALAEDAGFDFAASLQRWTTANIVVDLKVGTGAEDRA